MDIGDIWNEICFLLSENIKKSISENDYKEQVIRAIEKLGWSQFEGEIKDPPEFIKGLNSEIRPMLAIYGTKDEPLIMIEIKRPSQPLSKEEPADQLFSYILQSKVDLGLLIGSSIYLFYNGKDNTKQEPIMIDSIAFIRDSEEGKRFVSMFRKPDFLIGTYKTYITALMNSLWTEPNIEKLKNILIQESTKEKIRNFLKKEYSEYAQDVIDGALNTLQIDLSFKDGPGPKIDDTEPKGLLKTVLETIRRYPEGISVVMLKKRTGFGPRQISNALYKLTKSGAINSVERGMYKAKEDIEEDIGDTIKI